MTCLFNEPWVGKCDKEANDDGICCPAHAKEKCQVCGEQATTRCQASIGFMCGIPLCHLCGVGEMCLFHAGSGPLFAIRSLLGAGPVQSALATIDLLKKQAAEMKALIARLRSIRFGKRTMEEFERAISKMES